MTALRNSGAFECAVGVTIAIDDGYFLEMVGEDSRRAHSRHASANHNRVGLFGHLSTPMKCATSGRRPLDFFVAEPVENDVEGLRDGAFNVEFAAATRPFVDQREVGGA